MLEEIEKIEQEENLSQKVKSKKRIRGLLIGINAVLACYFIFEMTMKVVNYVKTFNDTSDFIVLYNNSKKKSEELYGQYILQDNDGFVSQDIYDFGLYGDYLHLSYQSIEVGCFSSFDTIYPRRIKNFNEKTDIAYQSSNNKVIGKNYLDGGLKLSDFDDGEYILFDKYVMADNYADKHPAIRLKSGESINQILYSLPLDNGERRKIVIRSMNTSPALVISISDIKTLPKDYYDFVLIGEKAEIYKDLISPNYKVYVADSLASACQVEANYCFVLDDNVNEVIGSNYLMNENVKKDVLYGGETSLANLDANKYIRELGGHLTFAGSAIKEEPSSFEVKPYIDSYQKGKYTLVFNSSTNFADILKIIN